MDGVTDQPYRYIAKKVGQPDLIITEFTAAEGLSRNAQKLLQDFEYDESQRPIVAQIFGKDPESFRTAALIAGYLGFDGVDINMGCPAKSVQQSGSGAALIENPRLASRIIRATQAGLEDFAAGKKLEKITTLKSKMIAQIYSRHQQLPENYQKSRHLPLSVKTRIGVSEPITKNWITHLAQHELAAISLHGRTLKQMYTGQADWTEIAIAVEIAHEAGILLLGNGDVNSVTSAANKIERSGVDGILVGRATFGNPWILSQLINWRQNREKADFKPENPTLAQKILVALEHGQIHEQFRPGFFLPMRKHLAWYIKDFPNASDYRVKLMQANSASEVKEILKPLLKQIKQKD